MLVPDAAAFRPDPQSFGVPAVDVTALYAPTTDYVVRALDQDQRIDPDDGRLIPIVVVSFVVPGLPGDFTIRIDNYAFTHADPLAYMRERSYLLRALYALPERLPAYADLAGVSPQVGTTLEAAAIAAAGQAA